VLLPKVAVEHFDTSYYHISFLKVPIDGNYHHHHFSLLLSADTHSLIYKQTL